MPARIPSETLLQRLKDFAEELGETPTATKMEAEGPHGAAVYQRRFGGWNNALREAGLETNSAPQGTKTQLVEDISAVSDALGRTPTFEEYGEHSAFPPSQAIDRFGSWNEALSEAGLESNQKGVVMKEEVIAEIVRIRDLIGEVPLRVDFEAHAEFSTRPIYRHFNSYPEAVTAAGFTPKRGHQYTRQELLDELTRLNQCLGHTPRRRDVDERSEIPSSHFQEEFGGWVNAVKAAGYELNEYSQNHKLDRDTLIAELQRLKQELGRIPTSSDMETHGNHTCDPYWRCFTTWRDALEAAGIDAEAYNPNSPEYRDYLPTEQELLDEIERLADELGETPVAQDMRFNGKYDVGTLSRRFGSWSAALEAAGFERNTNRGISNSVILEEIQRLTQKLGRPPRRHELYAMSHMLPSQASRRFGGWFAALRQAGVEPDIAWDVTPEDLEAEFERVKDALGYVPSGAEIDEFGEYSVGTYKNKFGSWNEAVRAYGHTPRYASPGDGDPAITYGDNWQEQRERCIQRDNEQCIVCSIDREEHYEVWNRDLSVHHIERFVEVYERTQSAIEANQLDNLVTVCRSCHHRIEGRDEAYFGELREGSQG